MNDTDKRQSLAAKHLALLRVEQMAAREWNGLSSPGYISWQGHRPDSMVCKCCGRSIMQEGQRLPTYAEAVLKFDDNSSHATPLCRSCLDAGLTQPTLEAIYCADLAALATEEDMEGDIFMRWGMMSARRVVGYVPGW